MARPRWGVSSADWRAHAVDEGADDPHGVYVARCGHQLRRADALYDEPPTRICQSCVTDQPLTHPERTPHMTGPPRPPPRTNVLHLAGTQGTARSWALAGCSWKVNQSSSASNTSYPPSRGSTL